MTAKLSHRLQTLAEIAAKAGAVVMRHYPTGCESSGEGSTARR